MADFPPADILPVPMIKPHNKTEQIKNNDKKAHFFRSLCQGKNKESLFLLTDKKQPSGYFLSVNKNFKEQCTEI